MRARPASARLVSRQFVRHKDATTRCTQTLKRRIKYRSRIAVRLLLDAGHQAFEGCGYLLWGFHGRQVTHRVDLREYRVRQRGSHRHSV